MMRFTASKPHSASPTRRHDPRHFLECASVKGTLAQITDKAVLLVGEALPPNAWIPLHRLDVFSRAKAIDAVRGQEISLRVELQFAQDNKLV